MKIKVTNTWCSLLIGDENNTHDMYTLKELKKKKKRIDILSATVHNNPLPESTTNIVQTASWCHIKSSKQQMSDHRDMRQ